MTRGSCPPLWLWVFQLSVLHSQATPGPFPGLVSRVKGIMIGKVTASWMEHKDGGGFRALKAFEDTTGREVRMEYA